MFRMDPPLVRSLCALLDGSVYLRRVRPFTAGVTVVEALAIFLMVVGHGATFAFLRASGFKRSTETLWQSFDQARHALLEEQTQRRQVDNAWQQGKIQNPWWAWIIVCLYNPESGFEILNLYFETKRRGPNMNLTNQISRRCGRASLMR